MRLSARRLNRTLLQRQHLLRRRSATPAEGVGHLLGLQAQESLPPYLSLAARLVDPDPHAVTRGLEDRTLVRLLTMRGTVHLLLASDAVTLRPWTQARMEAAIRAGQQIGTARDVDRAAFDRAVVAALGDGPLALGDLGERLAASFPGPSATQLGNLARVAQPLAQLPPRGAWRATGGVVYDRVDRWTGLSLAQPDVPELVRRYLRAYGPARAADLTTWSGVTGLGPVVAAMPDLVRHQDEAGRALVDVADGVLADEDVDAPVRLLGRYDELWLAHADRDRVTGPEARARWSGPNGATASTVFVDGVLAGLWRESAGRVTDVEVWPVLTRAQRADLAEEVGRVESLLAR